MRAIGTLGNQVWYRANWRELQARDYSLEAADEVVERYRLVLQKKEGSGDDAMIAAHLLSVDTWLRCQVEAYTMAGLSAQEISTRFWIDESVLRLYQQVFCDIEPLKDHPGSLLRACFDSSIGKDIARLRLFGARYGQLFLDWMLSKMTSLSEEQFATIENRLRTALLMKAMEVEVTPLSDSERYDMLLKIVKTLSQYKTQLKVDSTSGDLDQALASLKKLVKSAPAPNTLSAETLQANLALPNPSRSSSVRFN